MILQDSWGVCLIAPPLRALSNLHTDEQCMLSRSILPFLPDYIAPERSKSRPMHGALAQSGCNAGQIDLQISRP